jgi:hypothetical protein
MRQFLGKSAVHEPTTAKSAEPAALVPAGGRPLDMTTREALEPRFGFDFGKIRIHTDPDARQSAAALNARAFTAGNDIVFGTAQPTPALPCRNAVARSCPSGSCSG